MQLTAQDVEGFEPVSFGLQEYARDTVLVVVFFHDEIAAGAFMNALKLVPYELQFRRWNTLSHTIGIRFAGVDDVVQIKPDQEYTLHGIRSQAKRDNPIYITVGVIINASTGEAQVATQAKMRVKTVVFPD